jgi:DNA-binding NtrC family response regulator
MNNEFNITLEEGHDTTEGLNTLEAKYIKHVYKLSRYNQVRAAKMLGISRGCLRMKLHKYYPGEFMKASDEDMNYLCGGK